MIKKRVYSYDNYNIIYNEENKTNIINKVDKDIFKQVSINKQYLKMSDKVVIPYLKKTKRKSIIKIKKNIFGLYLIPITINNKHFNFIIDTGAQLSVITHKTAEILNVSTIDTDINIKSFSQTMGYGSSCVINKLKLVNYDIYNIPVLVYDPTIYKNHRLLQNLNIDGIIGWDILSKLDFEINDKYKYFRIFNNLNTNISSNIIKGSFPTIIAEDIKHDLKICGLDTGSKRSWVSNKLIDSVSEDRISTINTLAVGINGIDKVQLNMIDEVKYKIGKTNILLYNSISGFTKIFNHFEYDIVFGNEIFKNRSILILNSKDLMYIK